MDHTGHIWVTAFNEVGEQLLGVTANQLIEMKDTDETAFSAIFTKAQARSLNFACSAKQDTFNVRRPFSSGAFCRKYVANHFSHSGPNPCTLQYPKGRAY
jgi:hypothetical protein